MLPAEFHSPPYCQGVLPLRSMTQNHPISPNSAANCAVYPDYKEGSEDDRRKTAQTPRPSPDWATTILLSLEKCTRLGTLNVTIIYFTPIILSAPINVCAQRRANSFPKPIPF